MKHPRTLALPLMLLALALPATPPAAAQPAGITAASAPQRASAVLDAWLDAYNRADLATLQALHATHPRDVSPEDTLDWRQQSGGLDHIAIERNEPGRAVVLLRERVHSDQRQRVTVTEDGSGRGTIEVRGLDTPRRTQAGALAGLAAELDRLAAADEFAGAVLVARDGRVLSRIVHGPADRARGTPNTADTRFNVASVGKMFTSVAALQLVDAGKLSLDAPIGTVLTDYPNPDVARSVTLRQLLSHRSGIADMDFWDAEGMTPARWRELSNSLRTHADFVARYASRAPVRKPGEATAYNNFGFVVVAAMIERASGMDYYDYVQRNVFDRAGMADTGFPLESVPDPKLATGYTRKDGVWTSNADIAWYRGIAAGGAHSTVDDLLRFAGALQDNVPDESRLLSPAMLAEATRAQIPEGWYGLGFTVVGEGPLRRFGHGGDAPGVGADVRIYPESGYVLVAFANIDPPANYRPFRWLEPRMPLAREAAAAVAAP